MSKKALHNKLLKKAIVRSSLYFLVLFAMSFLPAGTFAYWEAWGYLSIISIETLSVVTYLLKKDQELLVRRMKMREKEKEQSFLSSSHTSLSCWPIYSLALTNALDGHVCH